jgi:MOSC domain-containing protein YiiM
VVVLLRELMDRVPQVGAVTWIGVRPERRGKMQPVESAEAVVDRGLRGDRFFERKVVQRAPRQVTLIQHEHLAVIAALLDRDLLEAAPLRRNVAIAGVNLAGLKGRPIRLGEVVLEITGPCHPCSRMEEALGEGGYQAMRGHGGWCAMVTGPGTLRVGDQVHAHSQAAPPVLEAP